MLALWNTRLAFTRAGDLLSQALAYRGSTYAHGALALRWASAALVEGLDSPSLRMLAGLSAHAEFEIEAHLIAALRELAIDRPDPTRAVWAYVELVAERTLDGSLNVRQALAEFCVFYYSDYDERFAQFLVLAEDLDSNQREIDVQVRDEARKLLARLRSD